MRVLLLALLALALVPPAGASSLRVDAPEGAPATAFLVLDVAGPADVTLGLPPGAVVSALAVDGAPVAWAWTGPGRLVAPVPANATALRLHATLPGAGPWSFSGIGGANVTAPGLEVAATADGATVARPATRGVSPWIAVVAASVLAVLAAAALARRDARAAPPEAAGLLDHLRELQARLRVTIFALALLVVFFGAFGLGAVHVAGFDVPVPVPGHPTVATGVYGSMVERFVPEGVTLVVLRPMDAVVAEIWVAVLLAMVAGLPVVAYEGAAFLGPALLPRERRLFVSLLPAVLGLFVAGVAFAWFLLVPVLLGTLYAFAPGLGATALLNVPELVTFAALLCLVMGLVFEIPVVLAALARAGIVAPKTLASKWRHALVGIFLVAAIVTPDPTVVSQVFVATPMVVLYFLGVALAYRVAPRGA